MPFQRERERDDKITTGMASNIISNDDEEEEERNLRTLLWH